MKKELIITATLLLTLTAPVFAASHSNNGKSDEDHGNHTQTQVVNSVAVSVSPTTIISPTGSQQVTITVSPTGSITASPTVGCNPTDDWENHGKYVSCVAHEHLGGQFTSEAAKSDIGKHEKDNESDENISPTVSITPSGTPSGSPTPSATVSPTLSITPTGPVTSAAGGPTFGFLNPFNALGTLFGRITGFFKHFHLG